MTKKAVEIKFRPNNTQDFYHIRYREGGSCCSGDAKTFSVLQRMVCCSIELVLEISQPPDLTLKWSLVQFSAIRFSSRTEG